MLAELLIEIVFEILLEVLAEFGFTSVRNQIGRARRRSRVWAGVSIALAGIAAGALAAWMIPNRLLPRPPLPGLSLLLGPLAAGSVMHFWGRAASRNGRAASRLATFWGGALFAFSFALTRLLLLPD